MKILKITMNKFMTRVGVSAILLLSSVGVFSGSGEISVGDPWVREAPPFSKVLGAYLIVKNSGSQDRVLTAASSPAFQRVEMHKTEIREGVARMLRQETVGVPANSEVAFESGGYHLMLMEPLKPLKAGDHVDMTLLFSDGEQVAFTAEVRKEMDSMGDMNMKDMPGMGDMQGMGDMKGMKEMKMDGM